MRLGGVVDDLTSGLLLSHGDVQQLLHTGEGADSGDGGEFLTRSHRLFGGAGNCAVATPDVGARAASRVRCGIVGQQSSYGWGMPAPRWLNPGQSPPNVRDRGQGEPRGKRQREGVFEKFLESHKSADCPQNERKCGPNNKRAVKGVPGQWRKPYGDQCGGRQCGVVTVTSAPLSTARSLRAHGSRLSAQE